MKENNEEIEEKEEKGRERIREKSEGGT